MELRIDSQWFPVVSTFAQAMTGDVRLQLPASWTVVGSGAVAFEAGAHVLRNRVDQIDVAFTASRNLRHEHSATAEVYHRTMPNNAVQRLPWPRRVSVT